ncbi:MAG: hypothetical protein ACFCUI_13390 [Bernardetiaceae bacterium]
MRFIVQFLLIALLGFLVSFFGWPYWGALGAAALVGLLLSDKGWPAFGAGFAGVGGLWLGYAGWLWWFSVEDGNLLMDRMQAVLNLPNAWLLFVLTLLLGGLLGGLATWGGFALKKLFVA